MMRFLTNVIASAAILFGFMGAAMVPAQLVSAAGCGGSFLTFPAWYDGLTDGSCDIKQPASGTNGSGLSKFIWRIVLNVIDMALQVVAYAAFAFIIYGGFKYLTSSGQSDKTTAARKTIMNAVVGLVISFFSVVIVKIVANNIRI